MKLSNERLVRDISGLSELTRKSLPVKISYAIAKNISKIESNVKIYNEERQKLIDKYSVKDENGKTVISENNQITIEPTELENWNNDMKDLQEIEVEIDIHKFDINILINSNIQMAPGEIMLIDYMLDEF